MARQSFDSDEDHAALLSDTDAVSSAPLFRQRTTSFSFNLLPLSLTEEHQSTNTKNVTLLQGIALVVGMQVGSGIFSSPGVMLLESKSVGAALLIWVFSGCLAWTGASSFAELGSAIPLNGGAQSYLQYSFGRCAAFLYSYTAIIALKGSSAATISLIFAEYLCRIMYHTAFSASSEESAAAIPLWAIRLVAFAAILLICAMNVMPSHHGSHAQIVLTFLKIIALLAVAVIGLVQLARGKASSSLRGDVFASSSHSPGAYALALYSGLWAFDGWDQSNYVAGEMKDVNRDLPRVIHISMGLVLLLFLIANISYFIVLPANMVEHSNTVALDFGKQVFGAIGGVIFALIVSLSCFGALNSSFYTSTRLIYVAAREGYLPKLFGKLSTNGSPINATILQGTLTAIFIAVGDFSSLIQFFGICSWFFYLVTVGSLLYLRVREPNLPRPYKTFLITPIAFSCVALFLLLLPIFSAPLSALAAFGFIASGLPVYWLTQTDVLSQMKDSESRFTFGGVGSAFRNYFSGFRRLPDEDDVTGELREMTERH